MSSLVRILTASIILILITTSFANAQTDLADYLSQKIYSDCSGQNITMSDTIKNLLASQNKSYLVKSNLTLKDLNEIITVIADNEPFDFYDSIAENGQFNFGYGNKDGRNILHCSNVTLTVNLMTYYLNQKRVDPFIIINQKVENISQKVDKIENYYTNASGQSNPAIGSNAKSEQSNWSIKISIFDISLITLGGLSVYFLMKWKNKKSKDK